MHHSSNGSHVAKLLSETSMRLNIWHIALPSGPELKNYDFLINIVAFDCGFTLTSDGNCLCYITNQSIYKSEYFFSLILVLLATDCVYATDTLCDFYFCKNGKHYLFRVYFFSQKKYISKIYIMSITCTKYMNFIQ
jgi:hypothetical protein